MIILGAQDPVHILLYIARAEVSELLVEFQFLIARVGFSNHQAESYKIVGMLPKIWNAIVGPVVQVLRKFLRTSRIWWCRTAEFALLPLYAAGPYKRNSHNYSHFLISSYTPTLAALIRARQQVSRDESDEHFVAIGQANPERGSNLQCVDAELAAIAQRIKPVLSFTLLANSDATVRGKFDALGQTQWLHLACPIESNHSSLPLQCATVH